MIIDKLKADTPRVLTQPTRPVFKSQFMQYEQPVYQKMVSSLK